MVSKMKTPLIIFAILIFVSEGNAFRSVFDFTVKKSPRINLPFLGIGISCNGCPPNTCDDDPAIVYGYCCGCAKFLDSLPILCPRNIICPLNGAGLCHDYEYMLRCCC